MIYKTIAAFTISLLAVPLFVSAAQFKGGETLSFGKSNVIGENLYAAGGTLTMSAPVEGDLVAVGGTMNLGGAVQGDVLAAGGSVHVFGDITGDIRAAGGNVLVSSVVHGELVAAGGIIDLVSDAVIHGDTLLAGGQLVVDGEVRGDLRLYGGQLVLNGVVAGDVELEGDNIVIGDGAIIKGDLVYRAEQSADIAETATIGGAITEKPRRTDGGVPHKAGKSGFAALFGIFWITKLFMLLALALVGYWFFRDRLTAAVRETLGRPGKTILFGFVGFVCIPVAAILLFVSIVGVFVGLLVLALYSALIIVSVAYTIHLAGSILVRAFRRTKPYEVTVLSVILGAVAYQLMKLVPVVGWLATFLLFLMAFGTVLQAVYRTVLRGKDA